MKHKKQAEKENSFDSRSARQILGPGRVLKSLS